MSGKGVDVSQKAEGDLTDALMRLMSTDSALTGPMNLGNPHESTVRELAAAIISLTGSKSEIVHLPLPNDDPTQRCPDISFAKQKLDWEPKVPLTEGLQKAIEYFDQLLSKGANEVG